MSTKIAGPVLDRLRAFGATQPELRPLLPQPRLTANPQGAGFDPEALMARYRRFGMTRHMNDLRAQMRTSPAAGLAGTQFHPVPGTPRAAPGPLASSVSPQPVMRAPAFGSFPPVGALPQSPVQRSMSAPVGPVVPRGQVSSAAPARSPAPAPFGQFSPVAGTPRGRPGPLVSSMPRAGVR